MDYTAIAPDQRREMLDAIGVDSIDALFDCIPSEARLDKPLDLPEAMSELELQRELRGLAGKNRGTDELACFAGGGAYDHFIPAFIDQMISRGEFLTAYTPYQGEASQGSLQAFFEFQTQVARLTGMEIANASLYEGASAVAEAVLMAVNVTNKTRVLVASTVHPDERRVLDTVLEDLPVEVVTVEAGDDGLVSASAVEDAADDNTACFVLRSPNVFGLIENWEECFAALKRSSGSGKEPLAIASCNPVACGLLKTPGACGADVAVAEGQPLGIPLSLGGPYLGLLASKKQYLRKMPGRLVGQTEDAEGRRAFCLSLQTREQHIRGAKATSNVCTNQGLLALRSTMYMAAMGRRGMRTVAEQCWHKAHAAAKAIDALPGYKRSHAGHFFHEFVVRCPKPARDVIAAAKSAGVLAGVDLSTPAMGGVGDERDLLVAVTEKRTASEIDALTKALEQAAT